MKDLQLIITGGTIDKEWDPFIELSPPKMKTKITPRSKSGLCPYLEKVVLPHFPVYENVVSMCDSSEVDDIIRQKIVDGIKASESNNIIISHGTDSLTEFARWLKHVILSEAKESSVSEKKIICLGGFYPLVGGVPSDAPFNLGFAVGLMDYIEPGVYLAMNAQLFDPDNVKKDFANARFIKI